MQSRNCVRFLVSPFAPIADTSHVTDLRLDRSEIQHRFPTSAALWYSDSNSFLILYKTFMKACDLCELWQGMVRLKLAKRGLCTL